MWRHNKQANSFENVSEGSFISFARLQYLHQESLIGLLFIAFIFCSFHKMSKLFSFQYFAWATLVQVCVFPGLVEPQAKLRQMGSQSLSWALERPPPTAFPTLTSHRPASKQLKFPFFFFWPQGKVLSPWFSECSPSLNFTLNHSGGKGIAEVKKYGKNVNNLPLKYTLRIFSESIISRLSF